MVNDVSSLQTGLADAIYKAANVAYAKEAVGFPEMQAEQVPLSRRCRTVSSTMVAELVELVGDEVSVSIEIRNGWEVDEHRYPVLNVPDVGDIVADPTWKQFLPKGVRPDELPDVLVGSRSEVVQQADSFGINRENQMLWQPVEANVQPPRYLTPAERIARAYDELAVTALYL